MGVGGGGSFDARWSTVKAWVTASEAKSGVNYGQAWLSSRNWAKKFLLYMFVYFA